MKMQVKIGPATKEATTNRRQAGTWTRTKMMRRKRLPLKMKRKMKTKRKKKKKKTKRRRRWKIGLKTIKTRSNLVLSDILRLSEQISHSEDRPSSCKYPEQPYTKSVEDEDESRRQKSTTSSISEAKKKKNFILIRACMSLTDNN